MAKKETTDQKTVKKADTTKKVTAPATPTTAESTAASGNRRNRKTCRGSAVLSISRCK